MHAALSAPLLGKVAQHCNTESASDRWRVIVSRYFVVAISSGFLFGVMDALVNANPLAQRLLTPFKPITRTTVNFVAGIVIDLFYGFVLAWIFLLLYSSLPGSTGLLKGITFGLIAWFFRVLMSALSQWVMFDIPIRTLVYLSLSGLMEMLIMGIVYGAFLNP